MTSIAFVTKSYEPDRTRCELLCRSIDELAPEVEQWIIVDARDRRAFQSLQGPRRHIITTEELLPLRVRKLDLQRFGLDKNIWLSGRTRPMRGWIVQQLAKLAICEVVDQDVVVHADSDVALIRRFDADVLHAATTESFPLYRVPNAVDERLPDHVRWHRTAEQLLGLEHRSLPLPDYIGGLVPWHREIVASLLEEISRRSHRHWARTIASAQELSEYILYGRFVDDMFAKANGVPPPCPSLCRCYWGSSPLTAAELERFIDAAAPSEVGVMISAKSGMDPATYAHVLERRWRAVVSGAEPAYSSARAAASDS